MQNRRELIVAILVVVVGWIALMVVLGKWQNRQAVERGPALPHYPGTESVKEQLVPNLGWRKYWFTLDQDYPSTAVYQFYQSELAPKGWRRIGTTPTWVRVPGKDKMSDLFQTVWVSADRVYEIDLQMVSTADVTIRGAAVTSEKRRPGMQVYVTLRRSTGPWLLQPGKQGAPPPGAIDLKETGK